MSKQFRIKFKGTKRGHSRIRDRKMQGSVGRASNTLQGPVAFLLFRPRKEIVTVPFPDSDGKRPRLEVVQRDPGKILRGSEALPHDLAPVRAVLLPLQLPCGRPLRRRRILDAVGDLLFTGIICNSGV